MHVGLVQAEDGRAVKRHFVDELDEDVLDVFERGVLVEVFAVDGGDHGNHGGEQQEAAIALVRFDHEIFAFAEPRGRSRLIYFAADDEGGIEMRFGKDGSDHGGGGGLAMRAGDRDAIFQAHQFGEHFGPRNHGNFVFVRFHHFRIVGLNGGRSNHHMRTIHVRRLVAAVNGGAKILQALGDGGWLGVRT